MSVYVSKVVEDDDGQTVMLSPEELLKKLALKPNEVLKWTFEGDKIIITRPKLIDTSTSAS